MTTYAKRKLKYSRNDNFNLLHYVEWDRFVTLAGSKSGLRVTLSYLQWRQLHVRIIQSGFLVFRPVIKVYRERTTINGSPK